MGAASMLPLTRLVQAVEILEMVQVGSMLGLPVLMAWLLVAAAALAVERS